MKKELEKKSLELIREHEEFVKTLGEAERKEQENVICGMRLMLDFILGKLPE